MDEDKKKKRLALIDAKLMLTLAGAGCIIVLFYLLVGKFGVLLAVLRKLLSAMSPIIVGFAIAFLLNPIVNRFRVDFKKLLKNFKFKSEERLVKTANVLAVIMAMLFFLAAITALLWILIPSLYDSINKLYENFDTYATNIENFVEKMMKNYPDLIQVANNYMEDIEQSLRNILTEKVVPNMDNVVKAISSGIWGGLKFVLNFIIGIIAAIYILGSKDKFSAQLKKIIYALFNRERGNSILGALEYTDAVFSGFLSGKLIDSLVIGLICFIFCTITQMPYAVLISVIVGVTNIIPFFGPFIGAIPSAVLVLVESPKMCIVFIIFIIILQQVDGNILGPLILGDTTGLSSFWVLFAIIVGGNLFGFVGMILGVPAFACLYTFLTLILRDRLNGKGLANDTSYFVALRGFDKDGEPVRGPKKRVESASYKRKRQRQLEQLQHSKELLDKVTHHDKKEARDDEDKKINDKDEIKAKEDNVETDET